MDVVISDLDGSELITTDLPVSMLKESGRENLITDVSLNSMHEKARRGIDGTDGILMYDDVNNLGDPKQVGSTIWQTTKVVRDRPRWTYIRAFRYQLCCICHECQTAGTHPVLELPLQPLQCVGTPFQKVAFDIVGPQIPPVQRLMDWVLHYHKLFAQVYIDDVAVYSIAGRKAVSTSTRC